MKTTQPYRWVILTAPPAWMRVSSFLNSYVHRLPTERRQGERMNERNGGWGGGVGNWDMKERRANKSPSEEDDAFWLEKQQGILSLSLFLSSFSYLCVSPITLFFFPSLCHFVCALQRFSGSEHTAHMYCYLLNCMHIHVCVHARLFLRQL